MIITYKAKKRAFAVEMDAYDMSRIATGLLEASIFAENEWRRASAESYLRLNRELVEALKTSGEWDYEEEV